MKFPLLLFFFNHRWIVWFSVCCVLQSFWRSFFAVWYSGHPGKVLQGRRFSLLCVWNFVCSGGAEVPHSAVQVSKHIQHLPSSAQWLIPTSFQEESDPKMWFSLSRWLLGCVQQSPEGFSSSQHRFHLHFGVFCWFFWVFFLCGNTAGVNGMCVVSALLAGDLSWVWFQKVGAGFLCPLCLPRGCCGAPAVGQILSLKVCVPSRTKKFSGHLYLLLLWGFLLQIQPLHNHGV